jgi:hypothetical protein
MEVAEEMELEQMNRYLKAFEQKAKVDAQAIARLEQAEAKKFEEKEARVAERRKLESSHLEIRRKILARGFAEWFVSDLQNDVLEVLSKHEYFYDEVMREIEMQFLPWLSEQSGLEVAKPSVINALAESALEEGDQFFIEQCNQIEIFDSVSADTRELSHLTLLRKMIPEDIVSTAWRKSKKLGHRKKKHRDPDGEEEGDEPAASEGGTESTYDSAAS